MSKITEKYFKEYQEYYVEHTDFLFGEWLCIQLQSLEKENKNLKDGWRPAKDLATFMETQQQLQKLKEYVDHKSNCKWGYNRKCTCGLDELLKQTP
jgi:hypothetical protein